MSTAEPIAEVVDIGVNLAHRSFHADRDKVIQRAFTAGVGTIGDYGHQRSRKRRGSADRS